MYNEENGESFKKKKNGKSYRSLDSDFRHADQTIRASRPWKLVTIRHKVTSPTSIHRCL